MAITYGIYFYKFSTKLCLDVSRLILISEYNNAYYILIIRSYKSFTKYISRILKKNLIVCNVCVLLLCGIAFTKSQILPSALDGYGT